MQHNVSKLAVNSGGESVWGVCCLGLGTGRLREAKSIHAGYNLEWGLLGAGGRLGVLEDLLKEPLILKASRTEITSLSA